LHGTPELIVLRQFCEREQSVMTLSNRPSPDPPVRELADPK
jgi:hypothetical protein